jgi:asparagine synthase (glutamine-hydrolysing)
MCGILGVVALDLGAELDRDAVERLTDGMAHRGPDGRGVVHASGATFGCRRLAILDRHPRANQPLWDVTGRYLIAYNGELFNYRELRAELRQSGAVFRTDSDTEVVLESYKAWGRACPDRFEGMFAFGVFDAQTRRVFLARDPLGIKPLYYATVGGAFIFASEVKAIVGYPGFRRELADEAAVRYLRFRYVPFGDQYYRGLHKLEPGHSIVVDGRAVAKEAYWDLGRGSEEVDLSADEIRALIDTAVRPQLHAEVPVALLLSGGLDSSILAWHARDTLSAGAGAFTAQVTGRDYDESGVAADVASRLSIPHTVVPISPIVSLDGARRLIGVKDAPLGMHNELAMAEVSAAVGARAGVLLCGEGADELLAGYPRIYQSELAFSRELPAAASDTRGGDSPVVDPFWRFVLDRYFYMPDRDLVSLLRPELTPLLDDEELYARIERCCQAHRGDRFRQLSYFFARYHLPGLLEMVDAATMASSVEARVPFAGRRFAEATFRLPRARKLRWRSQLHHVIARMLPPRLWSEVCDESKAILRDAYECRLPPIVLTRRKMGFPTPLGGWLARNDEARGLMLSSASPLARYFEPAKLRTWYNLHIATEDDRAARCLWLMINLGLFLESQPSPHPH